MPRTATVLTLLAAGLMTHLVLKKKKPASSPAPSDGADAPSSSLNPGEGLRDSSPGIASTAGGTDVPWFPAQKTQASGQPAPGLPDFFRGA